MFGAQNSRTEKQGSISRVFGSKSKRSSMSAVEDMRAVELRRHVLAVTMGDEKPLPVGGNHRHSSDLGRPRPNKLQSKRRPSSISTAPRFSGISSSLGPEAVKPGAMAPTITIQPIRTTGLDMEVTQPELYSIQEDGQYTADSPISPTRSPISTYPIYPGLQSPTTKSLPRSYDSPKQVLNTPRKLSNSSTTSTMYSRESVRSEMVRASSWGSKSSFDSFESSQWRPEPLKNRRAPTRTRTTFASLPKEVLDVVLEMLKQSHLGKRSGSCSTCLMRDLCNLSVCSRQWAHSARKALYQDIELVGADSATHRKKYKMVQGARILMLRRTLRGNPQIAVLVQSLKLPRPDTTVKGFNARVLDQYEDLVASVIMACPNLEALHGPLSGYSHSFKRVFHALSTRRHLKEMNWLIEPSSLQGPDSPTLSSRQQPPKLQQNSGSPVMPGSLQPFQESFFLDHHRDWMMLTSLSVHCLPGATITPDTLLSNALNMLPSLQHLHLCNLPANSFNDSTLRNLPALETLSLTHIVGITSNGLSTLATCGTSQPLRALHLRHTPLTSLAALARMLSNFRSLTTLSISQAFPPLMPEADSFALWMMPYLASGSLRKLHWDITSHRDCANVADDILVKSIAAGGFPQLRRLRTPNDPEGMFQELCRPVERIELPGDKFCGVGSSAAPSTDLYGSGALPSPVDAIAPRLLSKVPRSPKSPKSPLTPPLTASFGFGSGENQPAPACTDLRTARLAAQSRLDRARGYPKFNVIVTDEESRQVDSFSMGGYIGTLGSKINYHLLPDAGSTDEQGGLVDARDLAGDAGESLAGGKAGCTGVWNRDDEVVADKKERERWWHTERGRWTRTEL